MCSGLPECNDYHAFEMATVSLHLLHKSMSIVQSTEDKRQLQLRIGLHCGKHYVSLYTA